MPLLTSEFIATLIRRIVPAKPPEHPEPPPARITDMRHFSRQEIYRAARVIAPEETDEQLTARLIQAGRSEEPRYIPGRMTFAANIHNTQVHGDALVRAMTHSALQEMQARLTAEAQRDFDAQIIRDIQAAQQSEVPAQIHATLVAPPELTERILRGANYGVSMGTQIQAQPWHEPRLRGQEQVRRVFDDPAYFEPSWVAVPAVPANPRVVRDAGRTPPPWQQEHLGTFSPPRVRGGDPARLREAMRGCSVCGGDHGMMDCPNIDGPTPNWGVSPLAGIDPNATVSGITPPRRVTFPLFEIAANPTVSIRDVAARRFDLIDRNYTPGEAIGERFRHNHEVTPPVDTTPRPYCPTSWEKISGELIDEVYGL